MFSWGANRRENETSTSTPTTTTATAIQGSIRPPDYTRQQHLDSYLNDEMLKRSTRRVSTDDSTYDTVFQTVTQVTLILRVHFPPLVHPSAPQSRPPAMTLAGVKARHAWLDTRMQVIGYQAIASDAGWRQARMLLGEAVKQVVQHFQMQPPDVLEITDKGLQGIQPKKTNSTSNGSSSNNSARRTQQTTATTRMDVDEAPPDYETLLMSSTARTSHGVAPELPPIPTVIEELEGLSRQELDDLLQDGLSLMDFCNKLPIMQEMQTICMSTLDVNVRQANEHLKEKKPVLDALRSEVSKLHKELLEKVEEFRELEKKQDELYMKLSNSRETRALSPANEKSLAIRELTKGKKQAFEESEQLADEWLEEEYYDVNDFVKKFMEKRKVHHLQAAKVELLQFNNITTVTPKDDDVDES